MKTQTNIQNFLIVLCSIAVALSLSCCDSEPLHQYSYSQPMALNDGFNIGSLSDVNLDVNKIRAATGDIKSGMYGEIHSMLIYKDGLLVFEEYFTGHDYDWESVNFHGDLVNWDHEQRHNIHSVGKSITSACIGIAVDQGFIESVDQSIFDYFTDYDHLNTAGKNEITIEHLLTMSSGLEWDEWGTSYANENNDVINLWVDCEDPIACILAKPLVSEPGTAFNYSGGNMILLGEIIRNATGMDIEAFSWQYLFEPMAITTPPWQWIYQTGVAFAAGDQRLTSREMLKFGVMYLDGGLWNGRRILSEDWVENSANPFDGPGNQWLNSSLNPIPPGDNTWGPRGYAYTWWTHEFSSGGENIPAYWAFGWGGQSIRIFPDQNTVVVFTGANYNTEDWTIKIITDYVIPGFNLSNQ